MKNLTLKDKEINTIIIALDKASESDGSIVGAAKYICAKITIEQQISEIDESDPQQVWDEFKKEVERVTEVWKEKISGLLGDIPNYSNQSKVSYLIDKIEQFVTYMNEIENNL